jgi:class 3 adenylate cyclase
VGIDSGPVIIGNVGIRGKHRSHVAIGNTANVACKAMFLLPQGGIVLGNRARNNLSTAWQNETVNLGQISSYFIQGTSLPYTGWELKYRVPFWFDTIASSLSGL